MTAPAGSTGTYGFSVSSVRLNTSGANGSASGSVTVVTGLAVTASASKSGGGYQLSATVNAGSGAVKNATVKFTLTDSQGKVTTFSGTTSSSGTVSVKNALKNNAAKGTYTMQVTATSGSLAGSTTTTFTVS
jgi:uncharacterized membrane protein